MFQKYRLSTGESATRTRLFLPCVILWLYIVFHPSISFLQTEHCKSLVDPSLFSLQMFRRTTSLDSTNPEHHGQLIPIPFILVKSKFTSASFPELLEMQ